MANLSQEKRQRMLAFLETIREEHKDDDEVLIALGEIESELNAKKYGLVWERHEEAVDVQMRDNIPVFTECADKEITTTTGGVNFLLEGDNLHSLRLLEKTHTGKIDVIYIDPPYNTENKDFIYDDAFVDKNDGFRHSKWLSFMNERLQIAKKLLSSSGVLIISIGYHEVHNLMVICQEMFENKQVTCVTVQTSGGKPNGGFTFLQEYLVFITPTDFNPKTMSFTGGIERSPFEGLTLSTFDKTTRPNQTYPIFIDRETMHIIGVGKSLTERIAEGLYTGKPTDFVFDYDEAPDGAAALWPVSSKGADCVWRLISPRLLSDWAKGYIKISKNKSKNNPNEYSVQYLPEGVIKKIESGELPVIGTEENMPTLKFGKNQTVGSEIPTIWTEKEFFTTKGSSHVRNIFEDKRFPYPKPLEFITEILRATTNANSTILDFFAGSGTTGEVLFIFTHPLADHAIIVGVAHRLQFLLYSDNGLWLSVRELYKNERTDIFTDFFISASDSFPFCICKVEQIIVIIGNFCVVSHAFIDIKSLGNKACADNIYFIDFKELVSLIFNSGSTDTNNVLGRKCIDDSLRLGGVVGMLLINNDDKFHTGTMRIRNTIKEILTLAITNSCVTTFGYKFPVDECSAAGCKSI